MRKFLATVFAVALGATLTATSAVSAAETLTEKTKDAAETMKEKTKDAAETVKDKTKDAAESVKEKTRDLKDRMMSGKKDDVMAAQQALKDKGHDPGMIDGKIGPRTRAALKDYQKAEGLKMSGRLDSETRTRLGLATRTSSRMERATSPSASPATTPTTGPSGAPQPAGTEPSSSQSPPAPGTPQK